MHKIHLLGLIVLAGFTLGCLAFSESAINPQTDIIHSEAEVSLRSGEVYTTSAPINEGGLAIFRARETGSTDKAGFEIHLVDPNGRVIRSTALTETVSVTYKIKKVSGTFMPDTWEAEYVVRHPTPGIWQLVVRALADTSIHIAIGVDSDVKLEANLNKSIYSPGERVTLTLSLRNAQMPIQSAVITGTFAPDASLVVAPVKPLTLHDDGRAGDTTANDGIYATSFDLPDEIASDFPHWHIRLQATEKSLSIFRSTEILVPLNKVIGALTGEVQEQPRDLDGDGLFETLAVSLTARLIYSGNIQLTAHLLADQFGAVAHAFTKGYYGQGTQTVVLEFSGKDIRAAGKPGPYEIYDVMSDTQSIDVGAMQPYTTAVYSSEQFGEDPEGLGIVLDRGEDEAVDMNGDGLADILLVKLWFKNIKFDNYIPQLTLQVGAREVALSNTLLKSALSTTETPFVIAIPGDVLVATQQDGPYALHLLLFRPDGGHLKSASIAYTTKQYHRAQFNATP